MRFAKTLGFDTAHRSGLFKGRALFVGGFWDRKRNACIGLPAYIVVENGKPRALTHDETMSILCKS